MKVALVHDWLTNIAGGEKVVLALSEMFPEAPIYTSVYNKNLSEFSNKKVITSWLQRWPVAKSKHQMFPTLRELAFESFDFSGYDLVISSASAEAKGIITSTETVHISYIHTPTRYYWSGYEDYVSEPGLGMMSKPASKMLPRMIDKRRYWDFAAAQRADKLIANSKTVQARIKLYYKRESEIVTPPVDVVEFTAAGKKKDYYVCSGRLVSYKRVDLAIKACNKLGRKLIIVGDGTVRKSLQKLAGKTVKFVGRVGDAERNAYLSEARAMLFCGEEDFGISPVEAMASGTPVIAYIINLR